MFPTHIDRRPFRRLALFALIAATGCSRPPAESPPAEETPVTTGAATAAAEPAAEAGADPANKFAEEFADPPNNYRLIQYGLKDETLDKYPEYGIGGYMGFYYNELYNRGPEARKKIGPWVDAAHAQGAPVWLADDFGYPSGMGGGKVVERNPEYEVRGLATVSEAGEGGRAVTLDLPSGAERFVSAVLYAVTPEGRQAVDAPDLQVGDYEVTVTSLDGPWELHAFFTVIRDRDVQAQSTMAQFQHSGRYPDLLNPDAVKSFLEIMHAATLAEIDQPHEKVRGFYTNEPNLMQVHWKMEDAPFACVSWSERIPEVFEQMHGYDLMPRLPSLYGGDELEDRRVRLHFHQTVAKLLSENFARQIRDWCAARGIASGGHYLLNEYLAMHVSGYGDLMQFVAEFDVPGVDTGIPNRDRFRSFPYEQVKFFSSIADWKDRDEVIVLLDPIIGGGGLKRLSPEVPLLLNTANWSFFHGGNAFSAYLPLDPIGKPDADGQERQATGYDPADYRWFNEYIGRLSLVLRGARRETDVALYYPISRFQSLYRPTNLMWSKMRPQFVPWQRIWDRTVASLTNADLDFNVVHPLAVEEATIEEGRLRIGRSLYRYLVMPEMELLPLGVARKLEAFEAAGGKVIWVGSVPSAGHHAREDEPVRAILAGAQSVPPRELPSLIGRSHGPEFDLTFTPGTSELGVARFHRDGRRIYFVMNKTENDVPVEVGGSGEVTVLDPSTGEIRTAQAPLPLQIGPLRSMLLQQ